MAMYKQINDDTLILSQQAIYGSSRLGVLEREEVISIDSSIHPQNVVIPDPLTENVTHWARGHKRYELTNHLGNVLATVSDRKIPVYVNNSFNYYKAEVMTANDYYAFGAQMPKRGFDTSDYRFGYSGHEKIDDVYGTAKLIDLGDRWLDVRIGRTAKPDAKGALFPSISPFAYALNTPLNAIDPDGQVVIFINGMHNGTGGSASYWNGFNTRAMNAIGDHSARYVDGAMGGANNTWAHASMGGLAGAIGGGGVLGAVGGAAIEVYNASNVSWQVRKNAGALQGQNDAASIAANLTDGESVKIVSHSMGTAFARGYVEGLQKWAKDNGKEAFNIEYELDVNAFQGGSLPASDLVQTTESKTGGKDGGNSVTEMANLNSVPSVAPISKAKDITTKGEKDKGHAIGEMSTDGVKFVGNGGVRPQKPIEQGSNNNNSK